MKTDTRYVYHVQIFDHANFGRVCFDDIFENYEFALAYAESRHTELKNSADAMFKGSYEVSVIKRVLF